MLREPRTAALAKDIRSPCIGETGHCMQRRAYHGRCRVKGDGLSEVVPCRAIGASQSGLLLPDFAALAKDVCHALARVVGVLVMGCANQDVGVVCRHRSAEGVARCLVGRSDLCRRPTGPGLGKDIDRAGSCIGTDLMIGCTNNDGRTRDTHRHAEMVAGRAVRGRQFSGLLPRPEGCHEHIGGALICLAAYGVFTALQRRPWNSRWRRPSRNLSLRLPVTQAESAALGSPGFVVPPAIDGNAIPPANAVIANAIVTNSAPTRKHRHSAHLSPLGSRPVAACVVALVTPWRRRPRGEFLLRPTKEIAWLGSNRMRHMPSDVLLAPRSAVRKGGGMSLRVMQWATGGVGRGRHGGSAGAPRSSNWSAPGSTALTKTAST